jgi:hypothetical protein
MLNGIAPEASMTFVAGTFDDWQVTFYLSFLSNTGSKTILTETLSSTQSLAQAQAVAQATLTASLSTAVTTAFANPAVQAVIGNDWTVVWGPEVYVEGPIFGTQSLTSANFTTSNAIFVAYSPGSSVGSGTSGRYVVAIAGTNPSSVYDWFTEDFTLAPGTTWQQALQTWGNNQKTISTGSTDANPVITSGTYTGVSSLLAIKSSAAPATGVTLVEFLNSVTPGTSTLSVTGHSLGGALAPTLALALVDKSNPLLSNWPAAQVNVYPTAGASPGNQDFANYFFTNFTPSVSASISTSPWQVWNAVVWNRFDVVPNAWTYEASLVTAPNLFLIPEYYLESTEYDLATCAEIAASVAASAENTKSFMAANGAFGHLTQPSATPPVTGILNAGVTPENGFSGAADKTAIAWLAQVLYQHVTAYEELILQIQPGQTGGLPLPAI